MKRHAWILLVSGLVVACHSSDKASPPPPSPAPTAAGSAAAPAPAPAPVLDDLSGRWACAWEVPDGSGDESWTLMQDGASISVTLRGNDPGGSYTGSMNGTITGRSLELSIKRGGKVRGTITLKASANGKVLDGVTVPARKDAVPQHYACTRDDGSIAAHAGESRGGSRSSDATGECTRNTGVAYLEDCQQACWAAGSLNEGKCREKCTAYCKPRP